MDIVAIMIAAPLALISMAPVAAAVWTVWTAWSNPRRVLELNDEVPREDEPFGLRRPLLRNRIILVLSIVGYGVFVYGGISSALFWMPGGWGVLDDDAELRPYRQTIAMTFAAFGAIAFMYLLLDYCRLKLKDQWRRDQRRQGSTPETR